MRLLVLGGTVFLGRHIVDSALRRGHTVTTFNRGSHQNLREQAHVEKLFGDRAVDLSALRGRKWDAVIDTCCFNKDQASLSIEALKQSVDSYCLVSTVSVYKSTSQRGTSESAEILYSETLANPKGNTYGAQKGDCERLLQTELDRKALIIRPGLIVGPYDPTDRFTYWPSRVARGGTVLAPGRPDRAVQFIDARDLAEWVVTMSEQKAVGIYNATGPDYELTMQSLLNACKSLTQSQARFAWIDDATLVANGAGPWMELPLWIPETDPDSRGFLAIDCSKAQKAGLRYRPLEQTISDTYAWDQTRSLELARKAGLTRPRELELVLKCLPEETMQRMKAAINASPNSALANIAVQLEKLREEAEMLKKVSVQLEGMTTSLSQSSSSMDELLAILRQLEASGELNRADQKE
jgi:2'-hydroxyisoflavone reductase